MKTIDPPPEHGIHQWLARAAWQCRKAGMSDHDARSTLYGFEPQCRRRFSFGEVEDAVALAYSRELTKRPRTPKPPSLTWNPAATRELVDRRLWGIGDLMGDDEPWGIPPKEIIKTLFNPEDDTLFCVGRSMSNFQTKTFAELQGLEDMQFIVPAVMTAPTGTTRQGKVSAHSLENTGARMFIVVDLDSPPPREHPSIIHHLSQWREPALVMMSGGKGLHAWFKVGKDDTSFWDLAVILGADPVLRRNRSQFVRMPNGRRDNGKRQIVLRVNPRPYHADENA